VYVLDRQFQTLDHLIKFYSQHDVPNVEAIAGVRLTYPVFFSADETSDFLNDVRRQRRSRRVSAGDAVHIHNADEQSDADGCSDVTQEFQHSMSESQSDDTLLPKRRSWCRKIFETLKWSNRKSRIDPQNRMVRLVQPQVSCEATASTSQSNASFCENPKKYDKQPAIPDDSAVPAHIMRKNSAQSTSLAASGTDELAASAAANYSATAADAATVDLYYSEPRNVDRELSSDFIARLLHQVQQDHGTGGKCVCGLYLADSELPRGWSMHISTECGTEGQLFFTSPTGETSWELPTIVSVDLDTEQQDRIRQLMIEGQRAARDISSQQMSVIHQFSHSEKRISV